MVATWIVIGEIKDSKIEIQDFNSKFKIDKKFSEGAISDCSF